MKKTSIVIVLLGSIFTILAAVLGACRLVGEEEKMRELEDDSHNDDDL